jgi:WD40 repeat protein
MTPTLMWLLVQRMALWLSGQSTARQDKARLPSRNSLALQQEGSSTSFFFLHTQSLCRPLTSIRWIPSSNTAINSQIGFTADKLVCGTGDGLLVCLDVTGKLFAATKVQPSPEANSTPFKSTSNTTTVVIGVNCLSIDNRGNVYGGCDDRTIRVWCMEKGYLKELYILNNVHNGAVTATSLNKDNTIIVSGGDDGTINTWKIELE